MDPMQMIDVQDIVTALKPFYIEMQQQAKAQGLRQALARGQQKMPIGGHFQHAGFSTITSMPTAQLEVPPTMVADGEASPASGVMLKSGIVPGVAYVPGGATDHVKALVGNQAGKRPACAIEGDEEKESEESSADSGAPEMAEKN